VLHVGLIFAHTLLWLMSDVKHHTIVTQVVVHLLTLCCPALHTSSTCLSPAALPFQ
jgi:hypothetical protein